ncbi:MAG: DUF3048 domain-containing protein [Nocardioides sp.]
MRRVRLSLAATLAASLLLAACGGGDKESNQEEAAATKGTGASTVLESTWPLTGLPVSGDESASTDHPVFVVKIDNTSSSAPQLGLGKADMVVEELVEGGSTRLASFFYSQFPTTAGPVRSMRASDIGIVKPVNGQMVTSGAANVTINRLKGAGVKFYSEGAKGFFREGSRSAPYNLMVKLDELAGSVKVDEARPEDYLPWGDAKDLPKGQPAKKIAASFSGGHTTNWTFRSGKYHNDNTYAAEGDQFIADNVLVLRVPVGDAGYRDPAGNPVPETKFVGKGQAMLFHNGRLVRGTWSKSKLDAPLKLTTKAGELTVPAGHTWLELVPNGSGAGVTFGK